MHDAVTEHVDAPPHAVWALVSDIRNTGRFSPETFEAEWLDGASGPAEGARFRGHVRRGGRGPVVYWTTCRITACVPGESFGFDVVAGDQVINSWHYAFAPDGDGTAVTESFHLRESLPLRAYWAVAGRWRGRYNRENMRATLRRVKDAAEGR